MQVQRFADLFLNGVQRVERRHRLLKDHTDISAPHAAKLRVGGFQQVFALEQNFSGGMRRRRILQQF